MATRAFLSRFLQRGPLPPQGQPPYPQQPYPQQPYPQQPYPQQAYPVPPEAAQQPPPEQPQQPQQPPPAVQPQRPPTAGMLRRERRALIRLREERIRDLGGLLLEMYKREAFNNDLYLEKGAEIVSIEKRIQELDGMLVTVTRMTMPLGAPANRCACGAPVPSGAHFCANCGRPVGVAPVVACANCGAPLPAEAQFCAHCGRPAEPAGAKAAAESAVEEATAREPTVEVPAASDSWEQ